MVCRTALISNNPYFADFFHAGVETVYMADASAYEIAVVARDRVHTGWKILNHPLYGNFRPGHMPYRTMLLVPPIKHSDVQTPILDDDSVHFMEQALNVYLSCEGQWALCTAMSPVMLKDCSFIDKELIKATVATVTGE